MQKLLVLQTHPIQYYAPIYRVLAERARLNLVVVYLTDAGARTHFDPGFNRQVAWDVDLLSGYRYRILQPGSEWNGRGFIRADDSAIAKILREESPDWILLYGYASLMNWRAWWHARRNGVHVLYGSDSNIRTDRATGVFHRYIKKIMLWVYFHGVTSFLSPSEGNRAYLARYGAPVEKIKWSPFAIDVARFRQVSYRATRKYTFVWAGKFIGLKRCSDYLLALQNLRKAGLEFKALLVGDGPEAPALASLSRSLQDTGHLEELGFVNQIDMPSVLASAEVFVFTSAKEPYGIAATEAAACGNALIVADTIGCVGAGGSALLGENALDYPAGDVDALTRRMRQLIEDRGILSKLQAASHVIAKQHDLHVAAETIEEVVGKVVP